jgi:hypothetical protein
VLLYTKLERLARNYYFSLLDPCVRYEKNEVLLIRNMALKMLGSNVLAC